MFSYNFAWNWKGTDSPFQLTRWILDFFEFSLSVFFLTSQIPIAIIMIRAKKKPEIIKETIPQNEFSESIVSVVVFRAVVELCDLTGSGIITGSNSIIFQ